MKYVLIIGDGMADNPIPELDEKTPLQYAKTPMMDALASAGVLGSVRTVPEAMTAGSDTAILSIFGFDPSLFNGGRASLEAAAMGIKLEPGDIVYRCNMITLESSTQDNPQNNPHKNPIAFKEKKIISHSAGAIDGSSADTLITDLFNTPDFKKAVETAGISIYPGGSFRHIAVQHSALQEPLSLTPPHDHLGETLGKHLPQGEERAKTLTELMRLANEILENHPINKKRQENRELPANGIWFWANGASGELPSFKKRYGKTGSVISAVPLCQGIGVLMGLEKISVKGATGELNTNYEGKVEAALKSLETHDFTTIHIEAPDECTHNGDLKGKLQAIEWIDSRVLAPLKEALDNKKIPHKLMIISDHKTLLSTRGHNGEPVPFLIYDSSKDNNTGLKFNETDAKTGEFLENGTKLMEMLFQ